MPMQLIVDYLFDGVRDDLPIHVKRRLASTTPSLAVDSFISVARAEDELQNELSLMQPPATFSQPYLEQVVAATYRPSPTHRLTPTSPPRSSNQDRSHSVQTYRTCLICTRLIHRTIDCPGKQSSGCFKCGSRGHSVRDCPKVFSITGTHDGGSPSSNQPSFASSPFFIRTGVNNTSTLAIFDTGSSVTFIHPHFLKRILHQHFTPIRHSYSSANGADIPIFGEVTLNITLKNVITTIKAAVAKHIFTDVLLDTDWIAQYVASAHFKSNTLFILI
jgi:hypothetical protein